MYDYFGNWIDLTPTPQSGPGSYAESVTASQAWQEAYNRSVAEADAARVAAREAQTASDVARYLQLYGDPSTRPISQNLYSSNPPINMSALPNYGAPINNGLINGYGNLSTTGVSRHNPISDLAENVANATQGINQSPSESISGGTRSKPLQQSNPFSLNNNTDKTFGTGIGKGSTYKSPWLAYGGWKF